MQKGQSDYAKRKALELFDHWNDVACVTPKFTGYYYELLAVIENAVEIGAMVALGIDFSICDGQLIGVDDDSSITKKLIDVLQAYAREHPKWFDSNIDDYQDPHGVHELLEKLSAEL